MRFYASGQLWNGEQSECFTEGSFNFQIHLSEEGITYQGVEKWRIIQIRDRPIGRWCFVIEFQGSTNTAFCQFDMGEGRNNVTAGRDKNNVS